MCIILVNKKGIEIPSKETFKNMWDNNSDGSGFAYYENGKVKVEKGWFDFEKCYARIKELDETIGLTNRSFVFHARISTSSKINEMSTHPFQMTNDVREFEKLNYSVDNMVMFHNGILSNYEPKKPSHLSDTMCFVRDYIHRLYTMDKDFLKDEVILQAIDYEKGSSKLAFITSEDTIVTVGKYETTEDGNMYSNSTYSYNYYSSSYWSKWSSWGTLFKASEIEELDEYDLTPISGKPLDLEEFCSVLDVVFIPTDNTRIEVNGKEIVCNGNYCLDMSNNLYEIDYVSYQINYLGMAYEDEENLETEHPTEEDFYKDYDYLDEYEEFYYNSYGNEC